MELRHLRYFVAVAEELNFTRAAERLFTSQPSLSEQIRNLEDSLGFILLIRTPRKVELTEMGKAFLDEARSILKQVEGAVSRTRATVDQAPSSLSIGFVPSAEVQVFPVVLPALRLKHPNVQILLKSLTPPEQLAALGQGEIDIAFTRPPLGVPHFHSDVVLTDAIRLFIHRAHPMASLDRIDPALLDGVPHISTDPVYSQSLSNLAQAYLQLHGGIPSESLSSSNILMSLNLVAGGLGFALLPAYAEKFSPRNVVSRPLAFREPRLDLLMAYSPECTCHSAAMLSLIDLVHERIHAHPARAHWQEESPTATGQPSVRACPG